MKDRREPTHSQWHRNLYRTGYPEGMRSSCAICGNPFDMDEPESERMEGYCHRCEPEPEELEVTMTEGDVMIHFADNGLVITQIDDNHVSETVVEFSHTKHGTARAIVGAMRWCWPGMFRAENRGGIVATVEEHGTETGDE